jgi:hypothetical protein
MRSEVLVVGNITEKFDFQYTARDRQDPATIHKVNVARLTCSCRDFTDKRQDFPPGDVRRVCAHLYDKLYQTKADPLVQLLIRYGREMLMYRLVEDAVGRFVLGFPFGRRYIRAVAVVDDGPLLATYDLVDRAWSSGETPIAATRAAEVLDRMPRAYPEAFEHGRHA